MIKLNKTQLDKFKEAARELERDDNKETFDKRPGKLVKRSLQKQHN